MEKIYLDGIFEYWQYIWKRCISILAVYIWIFGWDILILAGAEHGSSRGPGNYQAEQGLDDNCMQISFSTTIMMITIVAIKLMIIFNRPFYLFVKEPKKNINSSLF